MQGKNYELLRTAIDTDIGRMETSVYLQESLISLSEAVLQKRMGLDLLFLQQGGLCAALHEECCFYIDHSGIIKDSKAKVREGLSKRKRERKQHEGWLDSWFSTSPWLTTLISTLLGPLIIILLLLIFGPCISNSLVAFIQDHFQQARLFTVAVVHSYVEMH